MRSLTRRVGLTLGLALLAGLLAPVGPSAAKGVSRARDFVAEVSRRPIGSFVPASGDAPDVSPGGAPSRTGGAGRAGWAMTPEPTFGFDAIPRIAPNWPADPTGAVGDSWFVTAVNVHVAVYGLDGQVALGPVALGSLFSLPAGTQVFDPKVVYDHYTGHFVLAFLAYNGGKQKGWMLIVSMTDAAADNPGTWCERKIRADQLSGDGKQWADYPGLGFNESRITLTTNQFHFAGSQPFRYAQILSFTKSRLYDCGQDLSFKLFTGDDTRNPDGTKGFTIQPAVTIGEDATSQYLLSFRREGSSGSSLTLRRLKVMGGKLKLSAVSMPSGRVDPAPYGTQGGGQVEGPNAANTWWDTGDLRLINAFYDAELDRVYAAHAVAKDLEPDTISGGYLESVIRWYEVNPGQQLSSSSISRKGIVGTPETDAAWPVVATDGSGNLFVAYSRASAVTDEFLSAWAADIAPGETAESATLLAAGEARFEASIGPERWGDYNGISRDPLTPSLVVVVNQYAASDGAGPTADWQQTVDVVDHL